MRAIPKKLRDDMANDPFYKYCCVGVLCDTPCEGRIQFHHVWDYARRQINEKWAILPACEHHHDQVKRNRKVKENFERVSLKLAKDWELEKYPKKDWKQLIMYLIK